MDVNEFVLFIQWVMVSKVADDVAAVVAAEEERRAAWAEVRRSSI